MSDMEKFFTRQKAQEGKKVFLSLPDGSESEHWIIIRGVDSDAYAEALSAERKVLVESALENGDTEVDPEVLKDSSNRVLASLVASWSFDEECTLDAVIAFLKEAPQIREKMDTLSTDRKYFFGEEGKSSTSTQGKKRSSPKG